MTSHIVTTLNGQPAIQLRGGNVMPALGFGTWQIAKSDVKEAIHAAIRAGYRHFDCAAAYGNEKEIGQALREALDNHDIKREDIFVTSKLWITHHTPDDIQGALQTTLSDLGLGYLDLYLVHWPYFLKEGASFPPKSSSEVLGYSKDLFLKTWKTLEQAKIDGRCHSIGVANMTKQKLEELLPHMMIHPAVNQVELHPLLQQDELVRFCRTHGIAMTAYAPLGSPRQSDSQTSDPAPMEHPVIRQLAEKYNVTPAQILIKWAIQRGTTVIPKSCHVDRIRSNFESLKLNLSDKDMQSISKIDKHQRRIKADFFVSKGQNWHQVWDENNVIQS